jgi:tetratricopeptide (TPR) repeat protein
VALAADAGPEHTGAVRRAPQQIGPYELHGELARGGMGVVFRARRAGHAGEFAVKVLLAGPGTANRLARFEREAHAVARLEHPGVVGLRDLGQTPDGLPYLVMDLVPGGSLAARLEEQGPLSSTEAARVTLAVARALHHAHEQGVLHRDVKPDNVLFGSKGQPLLTDFGLAKEVDTSQSGGLTASGAALGTLHYMPPEQLDARRGKVGRAADIYGLGATLYAMLTGEPPFAGETNYLVMAATLNSAPELPTTVAPGVHPDLEAICLRCLEKAPADRYSTAQALADDLVAFLDGGPVAAARRSGRGRGRRGLGVSLALACSALAVGLGFVLWGGQPASTSEGAAEAPPSGSDGATSGGADPAPAAAEGASVDELTRRALALYDQRSRDEAQVVAEQALALDPNAVVALDIRGRACFHQGDLAQAEADFRRVVELDPEFADGWGHLGGLLSRNGDLPAALAAVTRAVTLAPGDRVHRYNRCVVLIQLGRPNEAMEQAAVGLSLDPDDLDLHQVRAGIFLERREEALALAEVEIALARDSTWAKGYGIRAEVARRAGRLHEAVEELGRLLWLEPMASIYADRAGLRRELGDPEGAALDYEAALELEPGLGRAWRQLGRLHVARGRPAEGQRVIEEWLERNPGEGDAWAILGDAHREQGDLDQALRCLDKAVDALPESASPRMERCVVLHELGRLEEALADARAAVELDPENVRAWSNLSVAHGALEDDPSALAALERALALLEGGAEPGGVDAAGLFAVRGTARLASDDLRGASQDYEAALERDPEHADALHGLSVIAYHRGQLEEARRLMDRSLEIAEVGEVLQHRAVVRRDTGDLAGSLADLGRAMELDPENTDLYLERAETHEAIGDPAAALVDLETVLRLRPDHPMAEAVRRRIAALR